VSSIKLNVSRRSSGTYGLLIYKDEFLPPETESIRTEKHLRDRLLHFGLAPFHADDIITRLAANEASIMIQTTRKEEK
jgi:hypothetical protein